MCTHQTLQALQQCSPDKARGRTRRETLMMGCCWTNGEAGNTSSPAGEWHFASVDPIAKPAQQTGQNLGFNKGKKQPKAENLKCFVSQFQRKAF